jgi:hypothetical protein
MSDTHEQDSYGELARRLVEDGESFAKARVNLYRELAIYRATQLRAPSILFVTAIVLSSSAILAIVLGLVLALAPLVGGALAGLIVGAGALLVAALLAVIGRKKLAALGEDPLSGDIQPTGTNVATEAVQS